jgi:hypothetical protein
MGLTGNGRARWAGRPCVYFGGGKVNRLPLAVSRGGKDLDQAFAQP